MFEEEGYKNPCTDDGCDSKAKQSATVCVPVTITPFAKIGTIFTECCGKPTISNRHGECKGIENGSCKFTISQRIKVEIPVEFGANTTVGGTFVECNDVKTDEITDEVTEEYHD